MVSCGEAKVSPRRGGTKVKIQNLKAQSTWLTTESANSKVKPVKALGFLLSL